MTKSRVSFHSASAREWMQSVFDQWVLLGNTLEELVVVCDNAPCHSRLDSLFEASAATLLRLGSYSPMLNSVETTYLIEILFFLLSLSSLRERIENFKIKSLWHIWSKIKTKVKSSILIPPVEPPGVGEQRLAYLEQAIDEAILTITNGDYGTLAPCNKNDFPYWRIGTAGYVPRHLNVTNDFFVFFVQSFGIKYI